MNDQDRKNCILPTELLANAHFLAGEPAWIQADALLIIHWLAEHGCAVVGVELWQEDNGFPRWIASSDYSYELSRDWIGYCQRCADSAMQFVVNCNQEIRPLFNLNWISQAELYE